jgi:AraC-like DNA-binding protein
VEPRFEDRIVFDTGVIRIGAFRCDRDHPTFADTGPIRNYCFVFPRTSVVIEHERQRPFVANATIATLYNRDDLYRRHPVSDTGDYCDWFGIEARVLAEALEASGAGPVDDERRLFRATHTAVDSRTYLLQRRVFHQATTRALAESLPIEEAVLLLLDRVVRFAQPAAVPPKTRAARRRQRDLVHEAQLLLSRHFEKPLSLAAIAGHVGASEYHLCRIFRRLTGSTLHEYRHALRMRASLERIASSSRTGLTDLALGLGFSSHSHFTQAFRQEFGEAPSRARAALGLDPVQQDPDSTN